MSSPLLIAQEVIPYHLPNEICNIIQSYMKNDFAYEVLKEYYSYLYHKRELYNSFIYENYIMPNCYCHLRRRNRDCEYCYSYDYTDMYTPQDFKCCIMDNPQFTKICYGENTPHTDYNEDTSCSYDYHYHNNEIDW
jgi:hypothetical protein